MRESIDFRPVVIEWRSTGSTLSVPVRDGDSLALENEMKEGLFGAATDFECEDSVCLVVR